MMETNGLRRNVKSSDVSSCKRLVDDGHANVGRAVRRGVSLSQGTINDHLNIYHRRKLPDTDEDLPLSQLMHSSDMDNELSNVSRRYVNNINLGAVYPNDESISTRKTYNRRQTKLTKCSYYRTNSDGTIIEESLPIFAESSPSPKRKLVRKDFEASGEWMKRLPTTSSDSNAHFQTSQASSSHFPRCNMKKRKQCDASSPNPLKVTTIQVPVYCLDDLVNNNVSEDQYFETRDADKDPLLTKSWDETVTAPTKLTNARTKLEIQTSDRHFPTENAVYPCQHFSPLAQQNGAISNVQSNPALSPSKQCQACDGSPVSPLMFPTLSPSKLDRLLDSDWLDEVMTSQNDTHQSDDFCQLEFDRFLS